MFIRSKNQRFLFAAPGSEREQQLMDEYLGLVNERNLIVKKEERLNVLENIRDQEDQCKKVQRQIQEMLLIDGRRM